MKPIAPLLSVSLHTPALRAVALFMLALGGYVATGCSSPPAATPTQVVSPTPPAASIGTPPGDGPTATTATTSTAAGPVFARDTIKIGVDVPLTDHGDPLPQPEGYWVAQAVQLAIERANAAGGVVVAGHTYKLEMYELDDRLDPDIGAKNAEIFVADSAVLAVIGPSSSRVAIGDMPVFNRAGLAHISPSNTVAALTKPRYGQISELRPTGKLTYFRNITPDDIPAPAAADFMYDKLGARKVYIIEDTNAGDLPDNTARRFREIGGTVLGIEALQGDTPDFERIVKKIAAAKPDGLFCVCRGDYAATTRKQMVAIGLNIPFMILPNVYPDFIDGAGTDAEGSYGVDFLSVDLAPFPLAQQFHADYKKRFGEGPLGDPNTQMLPYCALAYDATNLIVHAMERAGAPDRELVRQQIAATRDFQGITGSSSFDENGDRTTRWVPLYQVKDGNWVFVDQLDYQGTLP